MTAEHTPRTGVTWQQEPSRREDTEAVPEATSPFLKPGYAMNRADRRAAVRALRRKGRR